MTTTTQGGFFADELTVTIEEQGSGRPVLLLHGGGGPQTVAGLTALSGEFSVIVPTHPGFALTPRPDWYDGIDDLALTYLELLDQRDLQDVLVVGSSIGGWIAAEMAVRDHSRISGSVLIDAVGIDVEGVQLADFFALTPDELLEHTFHDPHPVQDRPGYAHDRPAARAEGRRGRARRLRRRPLHARPQAPAPPSPGGRSRTRDLGVNTSQQVGGSVGLALLSTLSASAAGNYAVGHAQLPGVAAAAVHGYTTAFWWAAAIFATGLLLALLILPGKVKPRACTVRAALARGIAYAHHVDSADGAAATNAPRSAASPLPPAGGSPDRRGSLDRRVSHPSSR